MGPSYVIGLGHCQQGWKHDFLAPIGPENKQDGVTALQPRESSSASLGNPLLPFCERLSFVDSPAFNGRALTPISVDFEMNIATQKIATSCAFSACLTTSIHWWAFQPVTCCWRSSGSSDSRQLAEGNPSVEGNLAVQIGIHWNFSLRV